MDEVCRVYEQQGRDMAAANVNNLSHSRRKRSKSLNPLSHPFCEHSLSAAVDVVMLLLLLGSLCVLTLPYFKFILQEASELLPVAHGLIGDAISHAPITYAAAFAVAFVAAIAVVDHMARKCGNPCCKGLRKAAKFDIQVESEERAKCSPRVPEEASRARPLELGRDCKELEAKLKKMAPPNGRAVLILRAPCGCPEGRMEVWGPRKVRRIKK